MEVFGFHPQVKKHVNIFESLFKRMRDGEDCSWHWNAIRDQAKSDPHVKTAMAIHSDHLNVIFCSRYSLETPTLYDLMIEED